MIQKHCYECGAELTEKELEGEGIVPYCPQCQQYRFPMYNVAVSMVVTDEETGKILLIQQYGKPTYILVAGYVTGARRRRMLWRGKFGKKPVFMYPA